MMKTVLLVGGKNNKSVAQKGKELNINVIHRPDHKKEKRTHSFLEKHIKEVDCVLLFVGACSHDNMWTVKELTKKYKKPVAYLRGGGTTLAFKTAIQLMNPKVG